MDKNNVYETLPNGVKVINVTPHAFSFTEFQRGRSIVVPPSGVVVTANMVETEIGRGASYTIVEVELVAYKGDLEVISMLMERYPDVLLLGSMMAAKAYPGKIFAPVPHSGYGRGNKAPKRIDRFTGYKPQ